MTPYKILFSIDIFSKNMSFKIDKIDSSVLLKWIPCIIMNKDSTRLDHFLFIISNFEKKICFYELKCDNGILDFPMTRSFIEKKNI
jgi:hypothetical protein